MQRWQDDGEHIDDKGCQKAWKYLNTKRMVPDINQREMKEDVCRLEVVKREFIKEPSTCVIKYYESKWIHDQYSTIICHCLILFPQSEYTRSDGTGYPLSGITSVRHIFVQQSQWIACRSHASDNHPLWFAAVLNRQDCPARNSSSVGSRRRRFLPVCSGKSDA